MKFAPALLVAGIVVLQVLSGASAAESEADPDGCPCMLNGLWTLAAATVECTTQVIYGVNFGEQGQYSRRLTFAEREGSFCSSVNLYVSQNGGGYCQAYLNSSVVDGVCSLGAVSRVDDLTLLDIQNCEAALQILRSDMNSLVDCQ